MLRKNVRKVIVVAGAFPAAIALAGCGTEVLTNPGQEVSNALYKTVGQRPKSVACPQGVEAKAGKTFRCTLTAKDGTTVGVTVTETSITNGVAHLDIQVDKHAG
ncbi:MAG: DUF4333 domain-containing protein [Actinomycetota bacterium]|nr:DUF4333 domain-containing protein [Actinomycetota bacterium]